MIETAGNRILVLGKIRQIMDCFTVEEPTLSLSAIRQRAGLPESTTQRLVQNLVSEGFLDRDGSGYRIGLGVARWAINATQGLDVIQASRPMLQTLREQTQESSVLYVRWRQYRTVVATARSPRAISRVLEVGTVMPLHLGSAGKVFLAFDEFARQELLTVAPEEALPAELLDQIRIQGWASSFEEREPEVASVSSPVFDHHGNVVAVVGIVAPFSRLNEATAVPGYTVPVVEAAALISAALGFERIGQS
ncbi:IclR family transcriptional regulator [Cryobacterium suzukii]|uniref:IclR family transcriptional regulator n=1 Tax=Cryobacterium suzukii TaxID=1259198 RepID=A0A4R9ADS0_9MICO|nr:IclR family transcriptional regulator [Cryobacterium suzukii]TFD58930.1 IclR family transcriptional regulator [Cryobacterium suzukii]